MIRYEEAILTELQGNTPKEKYDYLLNLKKECPLCNAKLDTREIAYMYNNLSEEYKRIAYKFLCFCLSDN